MCAATPRRPSLPESLAGHLLLAHPALRDENFRRTVVLLSSHDGEGAMGVVLNRPTGRKLADFGADFVLGPLAGVPVFTGGPVAPRQLILCAWRLRPEEEGEGVQLLFGLDAARAVELAEEPGVHLRAYLGHAGWSGGQLEGELEGDSWVVTEMDAELPELAPDVTLWRHLLGAVDPGWRLHAGEPDDPGLN